MNYEKYHDGDDVCGGVSLVVDDNRGEYAKNINTPKIKS